MTTKSIRAIVPGYDDYAVTSEGEVWSFRTMCYLKPVKKHGYYAVTLYNSKGKKTFFIHHLVAKSFIGKKKGLVIDHIDGNKLNNRMDNLEIVTQKENVHRAIELGLKDQSICKPVKCLTNDGWVEYHSVYCAATTYKISTSHIRNACNKKAKTCRGMVWEWA